MSCLDFGGQGYKGHTAHRSVLFIFQDIESREAEGDIAEKTIGIYTVRAEGHGPDGPGGRFADIGVGLEGMLSMLSNAAVMLLPVLMKENHTFLYCVNEVSSAGAPTPTMIRCENSTLTPNMVSIKMDGNFVISPSPDIDASLAFACIFCLFFLFNVLYPKEACHTLHFFERPLNLFLSKPSVPVLRVEKKLHKRSVLHGTARDWWEIARATVTSWEDFQTDFLSAFLSEDYEEELADRVRTRRQGTAEPIRDFAFSYRALCNRWRPAMADHEMVKLIFKNAKPHLTSQLRGRVATVDELARLGHQLEKDLEQQLEYEKRHAGSSQPKTMFKGSSKASDKASVVCWRCNGHHTPASCPQYQSGSQSTPKQARQTSQEQASGSQGGKNTFSTVTTRKKGKNVKKTETPPPTFPKQLVVPITIRSWFGKAIVDTGATFTLIQEDVWKDLKASGEELKPWLSGPLYLANGETEIPLGLVELKLTLQEHVFNLPVAVLTSNALAYPVVLGLDFLFLSGLQVNVTDLQYHFQAKTTAYPFQPSDAVVHGDGGLQSTSSAGQPLTTPPMSSLGLLSSVPPPFVPCPVKLTPADYVHLAVQNCHLREEDKPLLLASFGSGNP
ncbi:hypothetical protein ACEWY4_024404 [Coilia grayii]|uniref:Retrotransposon gag domain-containing protein n=1 Tax=Coilia grayii TaxID=363190 RepID=A0ABD1J1X8_9TELE